jgi:hypothetical protein
VREKDGRFYEVQDICAREKIATTMDAGFATESILDGLPFQNEASKEAPMRKNTNQAASGRGK